MKKLFWIYILLFFLAGFCLINAAPEYAEMSPDSKNAGYLVVIDANENLTYYILEEEVYKVVNLSDYPKSENWSLKVFVAPNNENLREEYETLANDKVAQGLYVEFADFDSAKTVWAVAPELFYDSHANTVTVVNVYTYNELGEILTMMSSPGNKVYDLSEQQELKCLCDKVNAYLKK
jgi:hypothetical protein